VTGTLTNGPISDNPQRSLNRVADAAPDERQLCNSVYFVTDGKLWCQACSAPDERPWNVCVNTMYCMLQSYRVRWLPVGWIVDKPERSSLMEKCVVCCRDYSTSQRDLPGGWAGDAVSVPGARRYARRARRAGGATAINRQGTRMKEGGIRSPRKRSRRGDAPGAEGIAAFLYDIGMGASGANEVIATLKRAAATLAPDEDTPS
jgi:hypothetical protein